MSITAASLLAPAGPLASTLCAEIGAAREPGVSGGAVSAGYALAAETEMTARPISGLSLADRTAAGVAWAAAGALTERAQQILAAALSGGGDGASFSYSASQADSLTKQAALFTARYTAARETAATAGGGASARPDARVTSRSAPLQIAW